MRQLRAMTQPSQLNIVLRLPAAPTSAVEDVSGEESGLADRSCCRVFAAIFPILIPVVCPRPARSVVVPPASGFGIRQMPVCA